MLMVIEGIDAAGKNSQSKRLVEKFDSIGRNAVVMSFPRYETTVGRAIKRHLLGEISVRQEHSIDSSDHTVDGTIVHRVAPEDPLAFQCLMLADKMDAAVDIEAHIYAGRTVICDRWTPSAICFGEADGVDAHWLQRVQEVLFAFLNDDQQNDFEHRNAFVTEGAGTGHRYIVTSRHARDQLAQTRRQLYDLDDKTPFCVHDYSVPAAEEMLALHLLLQSPEHERYLRHLE